jgi:hypothetical protein
MIALGGLRPFVQQGKPSAFQSINQSINSFILRHERQSKFAEKTAQSVPYFMDASRAVSFLILSCIFITFSASDSIVKVKLQMRITGILIS